MKRYMLVVILILLAHVPYSFSYDFNKRPDQINSPPEIGFGSPFIVLKVERVVDDRPNKKVTWMHNGRWFYTYRLVIQRPSGDKKGDGIAIVDGIQVRLWYWAASYKTNPYVVFSSQQTVYQHEHPTDKRKILVEIYNGLSPGKHKMNVAILPVPANIALKHLLDLRENQYITFLRSFLKKSPHVYIVDKLKNLTYETLYMSLCAKSGTQISFELPAIMPRITNMPAEQVEKVLDQHWLKAEPDYRDPVLTDDPRVAGRVVPETIKIINEFGNEVTPRFGDELPVWTKVKYRLYRYENTRLGGHCPSMNPSTLGYGVTSHTYDTNSNPNDSTYLRCIYHKDGTLSNETFYIDNKIHGTTSSYFDKSRNNLLSTQTQYRNGNKHGTDDKYIFSKNGKYYLLERHNYAYGRRDGKSYSYYSDGRIHYIWVYSNGKKISAHRYDEQGKLIR